MIRHAKRFVKRTFHNLLLSPEGEKTIERVGHREYVGGQWDTLGTLQFNFLVERGMRPEHYLLDVACGALRLGVRAIPYLDEGHYLGIEKEEKLVKAGLEDELPQSLRALKKPNIVVSSEFEFEKLGRQADFAMAQSLFSHLTADAVRKCLERAFPAMRAGGEFYGTFFESELAVRNPATSHDHGIFRFTRGEMEDFGKAFGYEVTYIGNWNHPRKQVMVEYRKPS